MRAVLALTLAAFTVQSFLIQTHIHLVAETGLSDVAGTSSKVASAADTHQSAAPARQHRNLPGDDPASCPLCQEYLTAGHYVSPAVIALLLPAPDESTVAPETHSVPRVAAVSFIWVGRAPPFA